MDEGQCNSWDNFPLKRKKGRDPVHFTFTSNLVTSKNIIVFPQILVAIRHRASGGWNQLQMWTLIYFTDRMHRPTAAGVHLSALIKLQKTCLIRTADANDVKFWPLRKTGGTCRTDRNKRKTWRSVRQRTKCSRALHRCYWWQTSWIINW